METMIFIKTGKVKYTSYIKVSKWVLNAWNDALETIMKTHFGSSLIVEEENYESYNENYLSNDSDNILYEGMN